MTLPLLQTGNPAVLDGALSTLADLTSWKAQNQLGVVDIDGLGALLALVKRSASSAAAAATAQGQQQQRGDDGAGDGASRDGPTLSSASPGSAETPKLALWVLMNLASHDLLGPRIASSPGCIEDLVTLLVGLMEPSLTGRIT